MFRSNSNNPIFLFDGLSNAFPDCNVTFAGTNDSYANFGLTVAFWRPKEAEVTSYDNQ